MIKSTFQIKIEFPPSATEPERFFRTAASIIESYDLLDKILLTTIGGKIKSKLILEDLKKGSLLADFIRLIEGTDETPPNENSGKFLTNVRNNVTKTINNLKDNTPAEIVNGIEKEIEKTALESGIKKVDFKPVPKMELGNIINKIGDATSELRVGEIAHITTLTGQEAENIESITIPQNIKIDIKELEESLIDKEIENKTRAILLIRKLDFLGRSQWNFKKGDINISARILDEEWLEEFHNRKINLLPGDALDVELKEMTRYDVHGNQLSQTQDVIKVNTVIENK